MCTSSFLFNISTHTEVLKCINEIVKGIICSHKGKAEQNSIGALQGWVMCGMIRTINQQA
jgi:hypothetical protein